MWRGIEGKGEEKTEKHGDSKLRLFIETEVQSRSG